MNLDITRTYRAKITGHQRATSKNYQHLKPTSAIKGKQESQDFAAMSSQRNIRRFSFVDELFDMYARACGVFGFAGITATYVERTQTLYVQQPGVSKNTSFSECAIRKRNQWYGNSTKRKEDSKFRYKYSQ